MTPATSTFGPFAFDLERETGHVAFDVLFRQSDRMLDFEDLGKVPVCADCHVFQLPQDARPQAGIHIFGVSIQPSVSHHHRTLEVEYGVRIFPHHAGRQPHSQSR
jgi:hypothetical protein